MSTLSFYIFIDFLFSLICKEDVCLTRISSQGVLLENIKELVTVIFKFR